MAATHPMDGLVPLKGSRALSLPEAAHYARNPGRAGCHGGPARRPRPAPPPAAVTMAGQKLRKVRAAPNSASHSRIVRHHARRLVAGSTAAARSPAATPAFYDTYPTLTACAARRITVLCAIACVQLAACAAHRIQQSFILDFLAKDTDALTLSSVVGRADSLISSHRSACTLLG